MKYLIVVDMQNDFIDGSLGTVEAQAIVPSVIEKIKLREECGYTIIYTRDTHLENYLQTQEGRRLPVEHCIYQTKGWEIPESIDNEYRTHINKRSFGYTDWNMWLMKPNEIEIIGLCTDICVVSNALIIKANFPETHVIVDAKCCAGVTPESHKAALNTMKMCQIDVIGEAV